MTSIQRWAMAGLAFALGGAATSAVANELELFSAMNDVELATQRGGFSLGDLEIAIGLEQVVSVNGEMLAINRLTIPNLNQVVSGQMAPHRIETVLGIINTEHNGQALVSTATSAGGWMTLIQNDLNGSVIQNARQLNIELNNLGSGYRIPDSLRNPILQFLGR